MILDLFFSVAQATTSSIPLEVGIGTTGVINSEWPLIAYIKILYEFIVGAIGIVAAAMIMLNGLRWAAAAGNSEQISTAKTGITGAVVGLILALSSFVILNTINPKLTTLNPLDMPTLEFIEPVTRSEAAMSSGDITKDENLVNYRTSLPPELLPFWDEDGTNLPYITKSTYSALTTVLNTMSANPDYAGMKLYISDANRTLDTQNRYWACYQNYKPDSGKTCPSGCPGAGKVGCTKAAKPGASRHGFGNALDIQWINASGSGKYISLSNHANSSDHNACLVKGTAGSWCSQEFKDSVTALQTLMNSGGFQHICIEWWHFQIGSTSSPDSICTPGQHKSSN